MDNNKQSNKISVDNYLANKELLQLTYIPFDDKMKIVSQIINSVINSVGGLNTSLLRRISSDIFIETISNIDMSAINESGLTGFDELLYRREFDNLIDALGDEYSQFKNILDERVADYIRIETNPAIVIQKIYDQLKEYVSITINDISNRIQHIDVDELANIILSNNEEVVDNYESV